MKFDWKQPQMILQTNHLLSQNLADRFFFKKKSTEKYHLYRPWSTSIDDELMFKVKKQIQVTDECFIPLTNIKGKNHPLPQQELKSIECQLRRGHETQLIMFNGHVIHILKIKSIMNKSDYKGNLLDSFKRLDFQQGVVVSDFYVYFVNHMKDKSIAFRQLKDFIYAHKETPVFQREGLNCEALNKWKLEQRAFTYDYFVRSNELKDYIYKENWENLSLMARHQLVQVEMCRHEYISLKGFKQWQWHLKSMEFFSQAFLSELAATYIYPLRQIAREFPFFDSVVQDLIAQNPEDDFRFLLERIFLGNGPEFSNLDDFFCFIKHAKFFLYGVNSKISKAFHKEEFLWVENFLNYYQGLCESLLTQKLIQKMQMLVDCQNWFFIQNDRMDNLNLNEHEALNLKAGQLIKLMSSPDPEDNLFFLILEIKTEKSLSRKSIEDEVHNLLNDDLEKLVS